ncbi:MAG: hypothetical protein ACR2GC_10155 [Methyloceanibacter sp.]
MSDWLFRSAPAPHHLAAVMPVSASLLELAYGALAFLLAALVLAVG